MGCNNSSQTFELLSQALQWISQLKFQVSSMSHILNDFILFGKTHSECHFNLCRFLELSRMVNLPIKQSKTVLPSTTVTRHGIEVDTFNQTLTLPMNKNKEIQCLICSLNVACRSIAPRRAFLRRLIDLNRGCRRAKHCVRLKIEARTDIFAWLEFLQTFNIRLFCWCFITWTSLDVLHLTTYTSGFAYGAVMFDSWLQGSFPPSWHSEHISIKITPTNRSGRQPLGASID